jgi:hypothetical protein
MERGLLWLPLLGLFGWLAWAGWNEYRKLEAYKQWAQGFQRSKYDLYGVLGQTGQTLTWGRPTRQGAEAVQTISLEAVQTLEVCGGDRPRPKDAAVPRGCTTWVRLHLTSGETRDIPFTELEMAQTWHKQLQSDLESLQSTPHP